MEINNNFNNQFGNGFVNTPNGQFNINTNQQQNTVNNAQQNQQIYDGSTLLQYYNDQQWQSRENYYTTKVQSIIIPPSPTTRDMQEIESKIDEILTPALLDSASISRERDKWKLEKDLSEKETFVIQKQLALNPGPNAMPSKPTEKEIVGLSVAYLKSKKLYNNMNVYELLSCYEYRLAFITAVVRSLTEKKSSLIGDVAALKIESNIGSNITIKQGQVQN